MSLLEATDLVHFVTFIGLFGYILSYALLQFAIINGNGLTYTLLNLGGALFMLASQLVTFNLAVALGQGLWVFLSFVGLVRILTETRGLRFTDDELQLLADVFDSLPKTQARKFFDTGTWSDLPAGQILLTEGTPVHNLYAMASGEAKAEVSGVPVGTVTRGLIGEISVLGGAEASATVRLTAPSRVLVLSGAKLKKLTDRDTALRTDLLAAFNRATGRKLVALNTRLLERSV